MAILALKPSAGAACTHMHIAGSAAPRIEVTAELRIAALPGCSTLSDSWGACPKLPARHAASAARSGLC